MKGWFPGSLIMSSEKMEGDQIRTGHKIGVRKCKIYQIRCTKEKQNRKKKKGSLSTNR
jgi:hypothetical protein